MSESLPDPTGEEREPVDDRARFEAHVREQILQNPGHFAVVAIDLDGLKDVNDSKGHAAGDMLLEAADSTITSCIRIRRGDNVGSFVAEGISDHPHGDEFWVLLTNVENQDEVDLVIERLRTRLAETKVRKIGVDGVQASMGGLLHRPEDMAEIVRQVDVEGLTEEEANDKRLMTEVNALLKAADDRMYEDKMLRAYAPIGELSDEDRARFFEAFRTVEEKLGEMERILLGGVAIEGAGISLRKFDKIRRAIKWVQQKRRLKNARQDGLMPSEPPQE